MPKCAYSLGKSFISSAELVVFNRQFLHLSCKPAPLYNGLDFFHLKEKIGGLSLISHEKHQTDHQARTFKPILKHDGVYLLRTD